MLELYLLVLNEKQIIGNSSWSELVNQIFLTFMPNLKFCFSGFHHSYDLTQVLLTSSTLLGYKQL